MSATVVRIEERDGKSIVVYDNGMERDKASGRIVKAPTNAPITKENAIAYQRKRQEKAAAALRARILESTQKRSTVPLRGSADAVAEAGAYIWDEVVLGEDVYPRDRLEAWEKLSKYAGVLPSDLRKADDAQPAQVVVSANDLLLTLYNLARQSAQQDPPIDVTPEDDDAV